MNTNQVAYHTDALNGQNFVWLGTATRYHQPDIQKLTFFLPLSWIYYTEYLLLLSFLLHF